MTTNAAPPTIHDFGGFPHELYEVDYPAPGSPELARRVQDILFPLSVALDESWGIDHGTWSVLTHVFPHADIPVVQLAIDDRQPPSYHYELGKRLPPLRGEGVLVVGSGNLVHNLHSYAWGRDGVHAYDWVVRFEQRVRELLLAGNDAPLVAYDGLGRDAMLSVPTPDHDLPLLYVLGLRRKDDPVSFPVDGVDGGVGFHARCQVWLTDGWITCCLPSLRPVREILNQLDSFFVFLLRFAQQPSCRQIRHRSSVHH